MSTPIIATKAHKPSSNWAALKKKITPSSTKRKRLDKRSQPRKSKNAKEETAPIEVSTTKESLSSWAEDNDISKADLELAYGPSSKARAAVTLSSTDTKPGKYLALDCEMVGVGSAEDQNSVLARVSIVNYHGNVILDTFVKPREKVTDWRTWVSGVSPRMMTQAREFDDVQQEVAQLLDGSILVGHAVHHDLQALLLSHPRKMIRDTSLHKPFRSTSKGKTPALKKVVRETLGIEIQGGEHSSIEDAKATMLLYRSHKAEFETAHRNRYQDRNKDSQNTE
ncbi:RNA exonuclease 4 [Neolecta irregularis DAH-3]|uniref:RNA exonuclease 4 n=1 Tax=Neolecta irregularis (strain DAH-3) TaxID=1198029 RepID=A0A1U7LK91_NEOID|nr:RNA exonuclease 4 [Neolecta irregularis DAH-3]|eukprot:OLL23064.1 RNA exonuclease 4 [Neolecta irregularis DAH-3]